MFFTPSLSRPHPQPWRHKDGRVNNAQDVVVVDGFWNDLKNAIHSGKKDREKGGERGIWVVVCFYLLRTAPPPPPPQHISPTLHAISPARGRVIRTRGTGESPPPILVPLWTVWTDEKSAHLCGTALSAKTLGLILAISKTVKFTDKSVE
jgi:hypothetical protein